MSFFSIISMQDRVDFTKSLAVMLKSGISINEALSALGDQAQSRSFQKVVYRVRDSIEEGTLLSVAFEREVTVFGSVFVSLIKAGEESGTLQENLQFLAAWFERSADLKREVSSATLYPKIILGAALLLGGGLAVFILPRLVPLFNQLDVELPLITKMLLASALFLEEHWLTALGVLILMVAGVIALHRVPSTQRVFHYMYIHMPFMGKLLQQYQLALIMQLFATLLKSGLSLNESITIITGAATNVHYQESLEHVRSEVVKGTTLSKTLKAFPTLYPKISVNIIEVGEQSGTLANSCEYLSEYYTKEVNTSAKKLPTIIEPLLLVLIACIVGFVALAIIMPIYKLTGSITA